MPQTLFTSADLRSILELKRKAAVNHVRSLPVKQFSGTPDDQLLDFFIEEYSLEPIEIFPDQAELDPREGSSGSTILDVEIPFTGDPGLFSMRPGAWRTGPPTATVRSSGSGGHVIISLSTSTTDATIVQNAIEEEIENISFYINHQEQELMGFREKLNRNLQNVIRERRANLTKQDGLVDKLAIPLKRRASAPSLKPISMSRNLVRPLPDAPQVGLKSAWEITDDVYEHILAVIRHEGRTFESTPVTFQKLDEEELRDILLAHLNGHYKGDATGEAFRRTGKTDIRIEAESRAAFVAECKVWTGPKAFGEAIDQLLGYLTWRDSKDALIVFNKHNKDFPAILTRVGGLLEQHARFMKHVVQDQKGEWRAVFKAKDESAFQLHTFLFNLYAED